MNKFYPSRISYVKSYCECNQALVMQFAWIFLQIFKYSFLQGN